MDKYEIFIDDDVSTSEVTIYNLPNRRYISLLDQIVIMSKIGCVNCQKMISGICNSMELESCVSGSVIKNARAENNVCVSSELSVVKAKSAQLGQSQIGVGSSCGVVKARYRKLSELDDLSLSELDDLTLFDLDYIVLE